MPATLTIENGLITLHGDVIGIADISEIKCPSADSAGCFLTISLRPGEARSAPEFAKKISAIMRGPEEIGSYLSDFAVAVSIDAPAIQFEAKAAFPVSEADFRKLAELPIVLGSIKLELAAYRDDDGELRLFKRQPSPK